MWNKVRWVGASRGETPGSSLPQFGWIRHRITRSQDRVDDMERRLREVPVPEGQVPQGCHFGECRRYAANTLGNISHTSRHWSQV
jgi:hypothetical protein